MAATRAEAAPADSPPQEGVQLTAVTDLLEAALDAVRSLSLADVAADLVGRVGIFAAAPSELSTQYDPAALEAYWAVRPAAVAARLAELSAAAAQYGASTRRPAATP